VRSPYSSSEKCRAPVTLDQQPPETVAVRAEHVGMTFPGGYTAVADADFQVRHGEFVAIVGPSGCGKSTLLRMIAGLIAPTRGSVSVGDRPSTEARHRHRIGFVFQDPRLLPWRTAAQNIQLPLELQRTPRQTQDPGIREVLNLVGLTPADAAKTPRMLSGGMRMRVSLARALVTAPDLLLLDEPFGSVDDILRQQLNEELSRIWSERRWTAIFVTHNVAEAVFLSQRVLIISPSPARVAAEVAVPFEYPRRLSLRESGEFARCVGEISRRLRDSTR
jgi:NitT/TauT family transport system ATP-binding protein